jgi:dihydroflavonol-4-reductase
MIIKSPTRKYTIMKSSTVFITGSTGLLGINTINELLHSGYHVIALARSLNKATHVLPTQHPNLQIMIGDLTTPEMWIPQLNNIDYMIHAGAYFRESSNRPEDKHPLQQINVESSVTLYKAAETIGVKRFIFISSSGTIGERTDGLPSTEVDLPTERSLNNWYFHSKVKAEAALKTVTSTSTCELVTILPGWMFGPNDVAPTGAGKLVKRFLATKQLQLVEGCVSIADARDVATAIVKALTLGQPNQRYAVAGTPTTISALGNTLQQVVGSGTVQILPFYFALCLGWVLEGITRLLQQPNPIPPVGLYTLKNGVSINSTLAQQTFGVTFRPLHQTLTDTVAYFQQQQC